MPIKPNEYFLGTDVRLWVICKNQGAYVDPSSLHLIWKAGPTGTPVTLIYGTNGNWTRVGQGLYNVIISPPTASLLYYYTFIATGGMPSVVQQWKFYVKPTT